MIYMYVKVRVLIKSSGELMIARCLGKLAIASALWHIIMQSITFISSIQ